MSTLKVGSIQPNSGTKVNITGSTLLITTASGHFSGSYSGDGSGLEGVDGLPYTGSGQISGTLTLTRRLLVHCHAGCDVVCEKCFFYFSGMP